MRKSIGIEVGTDFIKVIVLNKLRGRIKIVKFLKESWDWKDNQDLPDSLQGILSQGKSPIYLSIPKSITFFRKVSFPFKSRKKILLTLPYEIQDCLPLPMEQLNFDFCIIGRRSPSPPPPLEGGENRGGGLRQEKNRTQVMVVAVSKEIIKKILNPFEKIGVKIPSLETSSTLLFNLCYPLLSREGSRPVDGMGGGKRGGGDFLLLNLDEKEAVFDIVQNKSLVESRSVSNQDEARLIQEILDTKKAFFGQRALEGIFLVGSASPALKDKLKEKLNAPVIHPDLTSIFKVSGSFNPEFSLALALSLKGFIHFPLRINLIEGSHPVDKMEKMVKKFLPKKNAFIFLGILFFLFILISPFFNLKKKEAEYRLLKEEIRQISKDIFPLLKGTLPLKELKRRLKLKGEGSEKIGLLLEKERSPLGTLKRVSNIIPKDLRIEVKSIAMDRKGLAIVANLSSLKEIDRLKEILQKSTYFEEIKVGETRLNKEKDIIEFSLNLKLCK
ncbi:MAG: hypothetical protein KAX20_06910 [Candidatus Omnitrophica bacterium]|nr:hypothetical protein [Candidatus Omnitrophota bacterium]